MEPTESGAQRGRVFTDAAGRSWLASYTEADDEAALEFTCLTESREPARVMAVVREFTFDGVSEDSLRTWLQNAPRLGRLTE